MHHALVSSLKWWIQEIFVHVHVKKPITKVKLKKSHNQNQTIIAAVPKGNVHH